MSADELSRPQAVFFDWDGTLADTYSFLNDAHNHLLQSLGFPKFKEGEYARYFGQPREILYPAIYKHKHEEAKALFERYVFENGNNIRPMPKGEQILTFLKGQGVVMGVISNKKRIFLDYEIENFGWDAYFQTIIGAGDAMEDKPSGAPLALALERLDLKPGQHIWYVGDTENDLRCARRAGCAAIFLRGHEPPAPLIQKYTPELAAENCADLHEILVAIWENFSKREEHWRN